MRYSTVEIIPDLEYGGFTARISDIQAYGEGVIEDEAIAILEAIILRSGAFGMKMLARMN